METNRAGNWEMNDAIIDEALRTAPLAAPPPLLYAAVMARVRREAEPRFRLSWLDVALSLFAAGMLAVVWFALRAIPAVWVSYLRNLVLWNLNKLIYLDATPLLWAGAGLLALATILAAMIAAHPLKVFRDL